MKTLKRMFSGLLALVMAFSIAAVMMPAEAQAAKETGIKSCPSKYRIMTGSTYDWDGPELELKSAKYYIKSVTSSDKKNLKAEVVHEDKNYSASGGIVGNDECTYRIGLFAKKEGKYSIKVNIAKEGDSTFSYTEKITVWAKDDSPFKRVTVNGKSTNWDYYYTSRKQMKFKVKAASGYKIEKLEIGTYKVTTDEKGNKSSEYVFKPVKSKSSASFKLSATPYTYSSSYSNADSGDGKYQYKSDSFREDLAAPTVVRITYKDRYTKLSTTRSYYFYYIK